MFVHIIAEMSQLIAHVTLGICCWWANRINTSKSITSKGSMLFIVSLTARYTCSMRPRLWWPNSNWQAVPLTLSSPHKASKENQKKKTANNGHNFSEKPGAYKNQAGQSAVATRPWLDSNGIIWCSIIWSWGAETQLAYLVFLHFLRVPSCT